jgi:Ran-binding protein 3
METEVGNQEKEADKMEINGEGENVGGERNKIGDETEEGDKNGSGEKRENAAGEEGEVEQETTISDAKEEPKLAPNFSSFQHLSSSQNAFSGLAGTGFSTSSFSFGSGTTSHLSLGLHLRTMGVP